MNQTVVYPIYRKYPHNKTFFKIFSDTEFEELQIIGDYYSITKIKAAILPERNYIYDLTFDYHNHWDVISEQEYENALKNCIANYKSL